MNIEDEKYFMGRDILNQCYSYNQLYYFYRGLGLKGIDRYINELQNESKSKSREIKRLNNIINKFEKYIDEEYIYDELGMKIFDASTLQDKLQELKGSDEPSFEEMVGFVENVYKDIKSQSTLHEELEEEKKIPEKLIPTSLKGIDNLDEKIEIAHIDTISVIEILNQLIDYLKSKGE